MPETPGRSAAEIRIVADLLRTEAPGARVAVMARLDLHFGLSRMLAAMAEDSRTQVRVFRDSDRALAWLEED